MPSVTWVWGRSFPWSTLWSWQSLSVTLPTAGEIHVQYKERDEYRIFFFLTGEGGLGARFPRKFWNLRPLRLLLVASVISNIFAVHLWQSYCLKGTVFPPWPMGLMLYLVPTIIGPMHGGSVWETLLWSPLVTRQLTSYHCWMEGSTQDTVKGKNRTCMYIIIYGAFYGVKNSLLQSHHAATLQICCACTCTFLKCQIYHNHCSVGVLSATANPS